MAQGKRTLPPYVLVNAQSLAASYTSNPTSLQNFDRACIFISCTGTPTGTVTVQMSNDYVPPNIALNPSLSPATWVDLPLNLNALTGGSQDYVIDIQATAAPWIRINYTRTGGVGSMNVVITAKES